MHNLEDLLEEVGGAGRFQVILLTLVLAAKVCVSYSMIEMSFANYVPKFCCLPEVLPEGQEELYCDVDNPGSNHSIFDKNCTFAGDKCNNRVFATGIKSVVYEWDLVCESKWMVPLTTSIQMSGVLVGSFLAGQVADTFGRRYSLLAFEAGVMVFNICLGFPNDWTTFVALRFFLGLSIGGYFAIHTTFLMEFLSAKRRSIPPMVPAFQLGGFFLALVSWQIPDWRWVHWFGATLMVPSLVFFRFIPESLRWLTVKGKLEEAEKVVEQIARWNNRPIPANTKEVLEKIVLDAKSTQKANSRYTYLSLYRTWPMFKKTAIINVIWVLISMMAYGFIFGASSLGLSVFLNIFLLNAMPVPFMIIQNWCVNWVGRKKSSIIAVSMATVLACICFGLTLTMPEDSVRKTAINVISIIARGFMSAGWAAIMVFTNELYPTVIRGLGFGAANTFARVGAMAAPFLLNFEDYPTMAFGVSGGGLFLICVLICFLEETNGKAMEDTFEFEQPADDAEPGEKQSPTKGIQAETKTPKDTELPAYQTHEEHNKQVSSDPPAYEAHEDNGNTKHATSKGTVEGGKINQGFDYDTKL